MKIKLLSNTAQVPKKQRKGDAGFDLYAPVNEQINPHQTKQIKLGVAIELSDDEVALTSERSSMAIKDNVDSIGNVIDSNYRGEISIILKNNSNFTKFIHQGDRIGQLIVLKLANQSVEVVDTLTESERGENAYGSSGK